MVTRREFLKTSLLASAGLALGASLDLSAKNRKRTAGAGDKVDVAFIGIGNRGAQIISDFEKTGMINVVALCDVDMGASQTLEALRKYPDVPRFKDFRELFDRMGNRFDAVIVAVPDHSHFPICMMAMALGKHVYVEKPMARTFWEAELMMRAAKKHPKVVTQVGNQGHSGANYFQFKAWQDAGIIRDITAVAAHMNNPRRWHDWDPAVNRPPAAEPIPETLDWTTWLSAVAWHDYSDLYHNGEWRSWFDFGMGALGDWGAHILDTVHEFLELGLPDEVVPLKLSGHNDYFFPQDSTIQFKFPARGAMPACDVTWYDGQNNLPPIPEGYGESPIDPNIPTSGAGEINPSKLNPGKIIYGKDIMFKGASHGSTLSIIPEEQAADMASRLPEVPESPSNHFENFLLACQGLEETRSPFELHGPLSQVFSLGVIAQRLNVPLKFDRATGRITNNTFADAMLAGPPPRSGWESFYKL